MTATVDAETLLHEADLLPWNGVPGGDSEVTRAFETLDEISGGDDRE